MKTRNPNQGRSKGLRKSSDEQAATQRKAPVPEGRVRVKFHDHDGAHSNAQSNCVISEMALCGLTFASNKTQRPMGDLLTEAVEQFLMPIVGDWSEKKPLPPLRGVFDFPRPTEEELEQLPCGVSAARSALECWHTKWIENDACLRYGFEASSWYEQLRHHPQFREHAAALGQMVEGDRRLEALLTAILENERQP